MHIALIDSLTRRICEVNSISAQIAGRTVQEMVTIDWMSITHPDDVQLDVDNMARMNAGQTSGFSMEKRYLRPDGSIVWINMEIAALQVGDVAHPQHLCMIWDITERKRAEAALRESEKNLATTTEMLERTVAMARVGGWELDMRTMQVLWSLETCSIHEVDPPVTPPLKQAINFYAPESLPIVQAGLQAAIEHGTPWDLNIRLISAKGRFIWVRTQCSPVMQDVKVTKLVGAFHDITERKQAEAVLGESIRLLRDA